MPGSQQADGSQEEQVWCLCIECCNSHGGKPGDLAPGITKRQVYRHLPVAAKKHPECPQHFRGSWHYPFFFVPLGSSVIYPKEPLPPAPPPEDDEEQGDVAHRILLRRRGHSCHQGTLMRTQMR
ncbi:hypothetical protein DUNSADRAFT_4792, partial [Dunaliella salina]